MIHIYLLFTLALLVHNVHAAKFKTKFHHVASASAVSLTPELQSTSVREVSGAGLLECSVKCLGMVECLMFGLKDNAAMNSPNICLLWMPDSTASMNLTSTIPASGLYVRYLPEVTAMNYMSSVAHGSETPQDCADLQRAGLDDDGPFWVFLNGDRWTRVYCDFHTDGGGWTVFQRRRYGGVDFFLNWADYKQGFGDIYRDFWLGNDNLHLLTSQDAYELRVDLWDFSGGSAFAKYTSFKIADEAAKYKLTLGTYNTKSTAGNSFNYHNNMLFTTKDHQNDPWTGGNCANHHQGAWWYKRCAHCMLNGPWKTTSATDMKSTHWYHWKGKRVPIMSEMKLRPKGWKA